VGGISACYYLPAPRPNKDKGFVAGTVIVLRGTAKDVTVFNGGSNEILTTDRVATQVVDHYHKYRFTLTSGPYVLQARDPAGSPARPWIQVVVCAGHVTTQNIPDECR